MISLLLSAAFLISQPNDLPPKHTKKCMYVMTQFEITHRERMRRFKEWLKKMGEKK